MIAVIVFAIKYFDGDFRYKDEIIDVRNITDEDGGLIITIYTIQRNYQSGKIKVFKNIIKPF